MTKCFVNDRGMPTSRVRPTELELTILNVLWNHGPSSVRDVQQVLDAVKPTGYTTVLKMLQIMTEKGLVERDETVRPQIYRAAASQQQTQRQLMRDLLARAYGGSVKALVLQALGTTRTSAKTLQEIEKLLEREEGGEK